MDRLSRFLASALALGMATASAAGAPSRPGTVRVPRVLAVTHRLPVPPAGVTELKFAEMFRTPVGPKGLEPTERLRALDGKRVRMDGYVVHLEPPLAGAFMLSPLPVVAGDEDESLADDIPPSALLVRLPHAKDVHVAPLPGLIQVTGVLHVGGSEAGDRVAAAHLDLDAVRERAVLATTTRRRKSR